MVSGNYKGDDMRISILCVLLLAAAPAAAFEVEQQLLDQSGANLGNPNPALNALGAFGSPYGDAIDDPGGTNGLALGDESAADSDAAGALGGKGDFWSRFSFQAHGPGSPSNRYGRFGNPYSPDSDDNPYGAGNPYAPNSPTNPYFRNGSIFGRQ